MIICYIDCYNSSSTSVLADVHTLKCCQYRPARAFHVWLYFCRSLSVPDQLQIADIQATKAAEVWCIVI